MIYTCSCIIWLALHATQLVLELKFNIRLLSRICQSINVHLRCQFVLHSSCDVIADATDGVVEERRVFEDISPASNDGYGLRIRLFTPPVSNAPLQASTSASATLEHPPNVPDDSASCSSFVDLADILSPPSGSDLPCYTTYGEGGGAGDVGHWSRGRPNGNPLAFTNGIGCLGEDAARLKVCVRALSTEVGRFNLHMFKTQRGEGGTGGGDHPPGFNMWGYIRFTTYLSSAASNPFPPAPPFLPWYCKPILIYLHASTLHVAILVVTTEWCFQADLLNVLWEAEVLLSRSSYATTPLPPAVDEGMARVVDTYRTHVVHCMSQVIDAVDSMLQMVDFQVGRVLRWQSVWSSMSDLVSYLYGLS